MVERPLIVNATITRIGILNINEESSVVASSKLETPQDSSKARSATKREVVKRSVAQRTSYALFRIFSRYVGNYHFDLHTLGRHHLPQTGGGLILSTHQSVLDPVLIGMICNRRLNYLARKTLFKNSLFAAAIRHLDAIEFDREGGGLEGLKETMRRLKRGELVLMFPEGTRTETGRVQPIKPGFISVARRSAVPLIPVAIVGAHEVLPRRSKLPKFRPIKIVVGEPIAPATVEQINDDELRVLIQKRLEECHGRGVQSRDYLARS